MTDQQINEAIAKLCGWTVTKRGWWGHPTLPCRGGAMPDPPDYTTDMNAMHEAESCIKGVDVGAYCNELVLISGGISCAIASTARQRAKAFLRVHGKWEE